MSHPQQQAFVQLVKRRFSDFFQDTRVLEVGSLDINGSVRRHFQNCKYVGIDVGLGPGVDVVCQGQDYDAPDGSFDVTISCETMEHNPFWKETIENMVRLCRPGGLVLMTCATIGRPEHGTRRTTPENAPLIPWDYYRNLVAKDVRAAIPITERFSAAMFCSNFSSSDLYFIGFKRGAHVPVKLRTKLCLIKSSYIIRNFLDWRGLRSAFLVRLVGEERYMAGPFRPWRRNNKIFR